MTSIRALKARDRFHHRWRGRFVSVLLVLIGLVIFLIHDYPDGQFHAWILDVGQGDAILLQTSAGNQILVDGGPDDQILLALGAHLPFWDHTIERLVVSHPHADHLAGLLQVLRRYAVEEIWLSGAAAATPEYRAWEQIIADRQLATKIVKAGDSFDYDGLHLDILFPLRSYSGEIPHQQHDATVVLKVTIRHQSLLLTGDLNEDHEASMIKTWCPNPLPAPCPMLDTDILKVPHHGSRTGLSPAFLTVTSPSVAIISVGTRNPYGHPHPSIMTRLTEAHVPTFRTDRDGTIEVKFAGEKLVAQPEAKSVNSGRTPAPS